MPKNGRSGAQLRDSIVALQDLKTRGIGRRSALRAIAGGIFGLTSASVLSAPSIACAAGNIRSLALVNHRTGESINSCFWIEGQYIPEALAEFNHILRDWREDLATEMDTRTLDIMAAVHKLLDTTEPFQVVSGYRSPQTNARLRSERRGVAKNSYHVKGMAVDLTMDNRTISQIHAAALSVKAGGVGKYSRSKFVHVDSGPVRDWGR